MTGLTKRQTPSAAATMPHGSRITGEPTLRELMDDPVMLAMLRSDGLRSDEVWRTIRETQRKLRWSARQI